MNQTPSSTGASFCKGAILLTLGAGLAYGAVLACSTEAPVDPEPSTPQAFELPDVIDIEDPASPMTDLEVVETNTEEVADRLLSFAAELIWRDYFRFYAAKHGRAIFLEGGPINSHQVRRDGPPAPCWIADTAHPAPYPTPPS